MALTAASLASPAQIRAALGVDEFELPDTVVSDPMYFEAFLVFLDKRPDLLTTMEAAFSAVSPTAYQVKLIRVSKLLYVYKTALELYNALPMFAFKQTEGGRVVNQRFDLTDTTAKVLQTNVGDYLRTALSLVSSISGASSQAQLRYNWNQALGLSTDPVLS